jgi:transcriptional regulator with XRE-family HTH domain
MTDVQPNFSQMLKQWRQHRHISQLDLASQSGISQRHISFLETGRSNPSRPMVLALADSLSVPLRERNALLHSAGYVAMFNEGRLDDSTLAVFRNAIEANLAHHEPYPAIVLDGRWNMVVANEAALGFFSQFIDPMQSLVEIGAPTEFQIVRLCLHENGLQPFIMNWQELLVAFLGRARRALLANPKDPGLAQLIEEITSHPLAPADWRSVWTTQTAPAIEMVMRKDDRQYRLFTMLAHFGAPADITLEELSIELFYPADEATKALFLDS